MDPSIVAIIPTYNEPDHLAQVVESIDQQGVPNVTKLIVNAGDPLPPELSAKVSELQVPSDHFWTHCIQDGFNWALERSFDFVMLTNADTEFLPGTLKALLDYASNHQNTVAVAPAYQIDGDGRVSLLYSHQADWGTLLYGKLVRPWNSLADAPKDPFPIDLTGGQGVVFPAALLREYRMDELNFPHYASDHDLWLQMRRRGIHLVCVPTGGIANRRTLSRTRKGGLLQTLWYRMSSEYTPESYKIMWRLRRKHLPFLIAICSFVVSFGLRWTLGFPKILRRS